MRTRSAATVAAGRSVGTVAFAFSGASAVKRSENGMVATSAAAVPVRGEKREQGDADHGASPQRIMAEVDCSIWSAAAITLAFIS